MNGDALVDNKALVLDLIEFVATRPRPYAEVMDAWRTSCPRLPIWEDAVDLGLVACVGDVVHATPAGLAFLRSERPDHDKVAVGHGVMDR